MNSALEAIDDIYSIHPSDQGLLDIKISVEDSISRVVHELTKQIDFS